MAAYSAVTCFRQTLEQLLSSDQILLDFSKPEIQSLLGYVTSLQSSQDSILFVPRGRRDGMNDLQTRMRDAIYAAQDKIEYWITKGVSSENSDETPLKEIVEEIVQVAEESKKTAEAIKQDPEAQDLFPENPEPAKFSLKGKDKIVGQEKDFKEIKDRVLHDDRQLQVIPITGMPGIGKTTLARSIYEEEDVKTQGQFQIWAWVTVSQDHNYQEIYLKLLRTMESRSHPAGHYKTEGADERTLRDRVYQLLYNQKFLIVVDDMWSTQVWDKIQVCFKDNERGSRILLTTRNADVAGRTSKYIHEMQPLSPKDSWKLLCYKVFGDIHEASLPPPSRKKKKENDEDSSPLPPPPPEKEIEEFCPPDLTGIGKRIAGKCKGLPLSLTVVGGLLSLKRVTPEYWKRVEVDIAEAAKKGKESYLEILSLSYNYLPGKHKGCFLYMGAFPEDSEIHVSKLIKLWVAEGFLSLLPPRVEQAPPPDEPLEVVAQNALEELIGRNLISVRTKSSSGGMKVCGMHDSLRDLAVLESGKEKFFHSRRRYDQKLEDDTQIQRRVSVHRNILMCLEEVYEQTKPIKYARSLLYVGPHYHHPMPFCLTFDLLKVLDAFTVFFLRFPDEFLQLVHLTYLSFTYNGKLSAEIAQLRKLQVLMVRRHPKIMFVGASFLPDEIWTMPQLRHLWFTETDFPALPPKIAENPLLLANLQTLANVNASFFTDKILDNMPNLKRLAMWMESPDKLGFSLKKLSKLEFFKFVVMNPIPGKGITVKEDDFFPKTLKRVHLSGCGLPWGYMEFMATELPDLEVLKLRELAFDGDEWSPDTGFENLKFLYMEYLGFKTWNADESHFPSLERLFLRHCYELEGIPSDLGCIGPLKLLELVDCSPAAVESAKVIKTEQGAFDKDFQVRIFSSWE